MTISTTMGVIDTRNRPLPSARRLQEAQPLPLVPSTAPESPQWELDHATSAAREGWGIFATPDSAYGPWQVQAFDDVAAATAQFGFTVPKLPVDDIVWRLVFHGKAAHHAAARVFLAAHNPIEWASIEKVGSALGAYQRPSLTHAKPWRNSPLEESAAQPTKADSATAQSSPLAASINDAVAALANPRGRVLLTTCLGIDLMDSEREVAFCTLSANGELSRVKQSVGAEWEIQLLELSAFKPSIAVIETDGVVSMHSQLKQHLSNGMSAADAVAALTA
ncbi:TPA: hypothetical protein L5U90_003390 [Pseudomonas aeruginosa]|nr:hypothetical protein [Pseudomonas aeruginosa]